MLEQFLVPFLERPAPTRERRLGRGDRLAPARECHFGQVEWRVERRVERRVEHRAEWPAQNRERLVPAIEP